MHCKKQTKLYNSLKKYGFDSFQKEILITNLNIREANINEILLVYLYDSFYTGLNATIGGDGVISPVKCSKPYMVERNKNMIWTDEMRQKLRYKRSEETLQKMRKPKSEESRLKSSISIKERNPARDEYGRFLKS